MRGALAAMAHIRRAGARDGGGAAAAPKLRYSVHHLFDLGDEALAHYYAALLLLGHVDVETAREVLELRDCYDLVSKAQAVSEKMRATLERRAS